MWLCLRDTLLSVEPENDRGELTYLMRAPCFHGKANARFLLAAMAIRMFAAQYSASSPWNAKRTSGVYGGSIYAE